MNEWDRLRLNTHQDIPDDDGLAPGVDITDLLGLKSLAKGYWTVGKATTKAGIKAGMKSGWNEYSKNLRERLMEEYLLKGKALQLIQGGSRATDEEDEDSE